MGSLAKNGLNNYLKQLQQHPLRTKVITAGVLSAISDIVSQKLTGIQKLQFKRILLKVFFGAAYLGPFGHFFHIILDKIFKGKRDSTTAAKKVLIEQLTSSPLNNLLFLIYYGLVIEESNDLERMIGNLEWNILYDDLLAIVSLCYQIIHILQIRDSGNLVHVCAIEEFYRENDELFLNSNAQQLLGNHIHNNIHQAQPNPGNSFLSGIKQ